MFLVFPLASSAVGAISASSSLLHGLAPLDEKGIQRPSTMTDGVSPRPGDYWNTELTAVLPPGRAVSFDMGAPKEVRAVFVVADGDDQYEISLSQDNVTFEPLWTAPSVREPGMRPRQIQTLSSTGRYVRIQGVGGDSRYSIGEIQLFDKISEGRVGQVTTRRGIDANEKAFAYFLHFVSALGIMLFASHRRSAWWWKVLMTALPLVAAWMLVGAIAAAWPLGNHIAAFSRASAAGIAALALLREVAWPVRYPASRAVVMSTLVVAGLLGVASFYNLGQVQFQDNVNAGRTFVHTYDMRVYYPVAKYFKELRFDGLYLASVAAAKADDPSMTRESAANISLRNLRNHRMTKAGEVWDEIIAIQNRFSPERWQEFVQDMRYFRQTMGRAYFGSLTDHGGNATPVWLAQAHLLFAKTKATERTLVLGGLVDPVLLLIGFLVIAWAYGWRASLLCMVVFGANDFVMFGSNWAGATMRHDWLAYLMIAVGLVKKEKYLASGVVFAMATSARAFPAFALVGIGLPTALWMLWRLLSDPHSLTRFSEWPRVHLNVFRVALGAVIGAVALFLFASIVLSFDAWPEWLHKVGMLDRDPHVNEVGLRSFVLGARGDWGSIFSLRAPVVIAVAAGVGLGALLVGWRRSLDQAAVLGAMMIPLVFNPSNYYVHFITILPLLAFTFVGKEGKKPVLIEQAVVVWVILAMCILQYWTTKVSDVGLHFEMSTVLLFGCYLGVLLACWYANRHLNCYRPEFGAVGGAALGNAGVLPPSSDAAGRADAADRTDPTDTSDPADAAGAAEASDSVESSTVETAALETGVESGVTLESFMTDSKNLGMPDSASLAPESHEDAHDKPEHGAASLGATAEPASERADDSAASSRR